MKILGNRVYLLLPELPDSKVVLLEEAKEKLKEEMRMKFDKLTVYDVGESLNSESTAIGSTTKVKKGDVVFTDPQALRRGITLKIDDIELICVNSYDIMHVW